MRELRLIVCVRERIYRWWQLARLRSIPSEHHVVRICKPKYVQNGEIIPQAFEPVKNEGYLSVHWLEYIDDAQTLPSAFDKLRDFLVSSRFNDIKPQKSGRLAALCSGDLETRHERVRFVCKHVPREEPDLPNGKGHQFADPGYDPHAGVYTLPWSGAEQLAVQQYLLSKVVYHEAGKK